MYFYYIIHMIEVSLSCNEAKISCTDCNADFETMQEIEEHYDHLINFDEVTKFLNKLAGAKGCYFHVNNFEELIRQLWLNDFNLMLPHFRDLNEEIYYTAMRNARIARNKNAVSMYA